MLTKLEQNRKIALSIFDKSYNLRENVVKLNPHNSYEHEVAKFLTVFELLRSGSTTYTEAIFKNGKRADIVEINSTGIRIWEIRHSEFLENIKIKQDNYPFVIISLEADDVIENFVKKWKTTTLNWKK